MSEEWKAEMLMSQPRPLQHNVGLLRVLMYTDSKSLCDLHANGCAATSSSEGHIQSKMAYACTIGGVQRVEY